MQPHACSSMPEVSSEGGKPEDEVSAAISEAEAMLGDSVLTDFSDVGVQEALSHSWDTLETLDPLVGYDLSVGGHPLDEEESTKDEKSMSEDAGEKGSTAEMEEKALSMPSGSSSEGGEEEKKKAKIKRKRKAAAKKTDDSKESSKSPSPEQLGWNSRAPRWYFVQVKPGCEQSCAISIRNLSISLSDENIHEVLVPVTTIMKLTKSGKSIKKDERFFPSYVLVLMEMTMSGYSHILNVPNVQYFMNDPNRDKKKDDPMRAPVPVTDSEMKQIFNKIAESEEAKPELKTEIRPGDHIRILSDAFAGELGRVLEVKPDLQVVVASMIVYGRDTSIEFKFDEVQVVNETVIVKDEDAQTDAESSKNTKKKSRTKKGHRSLSDGVKNFKSAGISSASDELAALLNVDDQDEWNPLEEMSSTKPGDDGFSAGSIIDNEDENNLSSSPEHETFAFNDDDDGFGSAEVVEEQSSPEVVPQERKGKKKKKKKYSLKADLEGLLKANTKGEKTAADAKEDQEELDEFMRSLEDWKPTNEDEDSELNDAFPDEGNEFEEDGLDLKTLAAREREKRKKYKELVAMDDDQWFDVEDKKFDTSNFEEEEHELYPFTGQGILEEADRMAEEFRRGERPNPIPDISDEELMTSIIETDVKMPEYDFTKVPKVNPNSKSMYPAPPVRVRRKKKKVENPDEDLKS